MPQVPTKLSFALQETRIWPTDSSKAEQVEGRARGRHAGREGHRPWDKGQSCVTAGRPTLVGPHSHLTCPSQKTLHVFVSSALHTYLCSFKHFPLVEDFHGINSFSVFHFDNSNLEHKWEFHKNVVNGTEGQRICISPQ